MKFLAQSTYWLVINPTPIQQGRCRCDLFREPSFLRREARFTQHGLRCRCQMRGHYHKLNASTLPTGVCFSRVTAKNRVTRDYFPALLFTSIGATPDVTGPYSKIVVKPIATWPTWQLWAPRCPRLLLRFRSRCGGKSRLAFQKCRILRRPSMALISQVHVPATRNQSLRAFFSNSESEPVTQLARERNRRADHYIA